MVTSQCATRAGRHELRKIIESARDDALFVAPYLDADFITQYMPSVAKGVTVRLLAGPHGHALGNAGADKVAHGGPPQVVRNPTRTAGDFYPGDLLKNVMEAAESFWNNHSELRERLVTQSGSDAPRRILTVRVR